MKFVIVFGPPAVGKTTVGRELSKITGLKLLHHHMTIDLVREFFDYGTPRFNKLNLELRRRIFEEVASSDLPGLIFTFVWGFNSDSDKKYVDEICIIFREKGGSTYFVELEADLDIRLERNVSEARLLEKPSKRKIDLSEARLLKMEEKFVMNTNGDFYYKENYLKINNSNLSAEEVAKQIKQEFNL